MEMPTWDEFVVPVLRVLLDGRTVRSRELYGLVADAADLTEELRAEQLLSGQLKFENRIGWATSYMTRVKALKRPARGQYQITDVGRKLLHDHPSRVTERDLLALIGGTDGPRVWKPIRDKAEKVQAEALEPAELDPVEQVETGIARIHTQVAGDLLARLIEQTPTFFENAVVDLLVAMGYGGTGGRGTVTQASNDGGIDGVIDQDTLGISRVYVQAKRYSATNSVQRPEIQSFVGALSGKADGGVFITTGKFSRGAIDYANAVPARIILIDGDRLTQLMIRYGVGVQVKQTLHIVEIDEDFFE